MYLPITATIQIKGSNMATTIFSTVAQFAEKQPAFTGASLRALIFNENSNGLAKSGAVIRIGRKVLINEELFFGWVQAQSAGAK
jgi:hypothetical protein